MKKVKPGDEDQSEHISRMNLVSRPVLGIMKNRKNLTTQSKISKCSRMGKMNSHSANIYSSSSFSRCPTPCVAVPCGISVSRYFLKSLAGERQVSINVPLQFIY